MKLGADLRCALRRAERRRGLSLVLIAALALGLGGATAALALADRVLVNPLGLPRPQRVVHIYAGNDPATVAAYAQLPAFAAVGADATGALEVRAGALPGGQYVAGVTKGFFDVAGVAPRRGRTFSTGELDAGTRVAVISHDLAVRGFDGHALGRTVEIGEARFTVVGVMPAGFDFPAGTSVWVPSRTADQNLVLVNGPLHGELMARLRPGVSLQVAGAQVKAQMQRHVAAMEAANPGTKWGISDAFVSPLVDNWSRRSQATVDLLLAAAGLLWLVACFNLGGVLLARVLGDQKDMATRLALGARRRRLAAQWGWEALVLIVPATAAAAGVAAVLMAALRHWAPAGMLGLDLLHPAWTDWATLAALALATLVLVGLLPALSTLRLRPPAEMLQTALYGKARTSVLWPVLVVAELAVALALTASAALLLASYGRLTRVNLGFNPAGVRTISYTIAPALLPLVNRMNAAPASDSPAMLQTIQARAHAMNAQVLAAAQRVAHEAALVASAPFSPRAVGGQYFIPAPGDWHHAAGLEANLIAGPYFRVLGLPLLRGRYFTPTDASGAAHPVIVSRGAARAFWGGGNPVGRTLYRGGQPQPLLVVGEVADIRAGGAVDRGFWKGQAYFPLGLGQRAPAQAITLVTRGPGGAVAAAVAGVGGVQVLESSTLSAAAAKVLASERFSALVLALFSVLALLLLALGVLGLLAHWVAGRRHEMAVRLVLGALPAALARTVLGRVGLMLALAVGLALLASPLEKSLLGHMLFGVRALDLRLWAAAVGLVCGVAFAAAAVPALRAARIQPAETLRHE